MHLNYKGDVTGSVGQIMGPDMHGAFYSVTDADYSPTLDWTRLYLKPADPLKVEVVPDEFGQLWIVNDEAASL